MQRYTWVHMLRRMFNTALSQRLIGRKNVKKCFCRRVMDLGARLRRKRHGSAQCDQYRGQSHFVTALMLAVVQDLTGLIGLYSRSELFNMVIAFFTHSWNPLAEPSICSQRRSDSECADDKPETQVMKTHATCSSLPRLHCS